jgi:eukaryotic-like serine/threonine-protein kinase
MLALPSRLGGESPREARTECPPEAIVARYAEQTLSREEHDRFSAHVARCEQCDLALMMLLSREQTSARSALDASRAAPDQSLEVFVRRAHLVQQFSAGAFVGRYRVLRRVGQGAMGIVYAAHDSQLDRNVALKVLLDDRAEGSLSDDPGVASGRLLREARSMAKLAHPNIVTVFEVGAAKGRVFLAMELIDGVTLAEWLLAAPPRDLVLRLFVDIARALDAAHRAGVVHRDLKPHNILVSRDGQPKVTDFGLADASAALWASSGGSASDPSTATTLQLTRALVGTPAYMAPEVLVEEKRAGPLSDQFSFAVCLHEALTGRRPYDASSLDELKTRLATERPRIDGSLPAQLRRPLLRALSRDERARFPSMKELGGTLEDASLHLATSKRRARVRLSVAGGVVFIALGSGLGLVAWARLSHPSVTHAPPAAPTMPPAASSSRSADVPPATPATFAPIAHEQPATTLPSATPNDGAHPPAPRRRNPVATATATASSIARPSVNRVETAPSSTSPTDWMRSRR